MRNIKYIFFIFTLFPSLLFSQTREGDSLEYNYWATRSIIEIVYSYMEYYSKNNELTDSEEVGKNRYKSIYLNPIRKNIEKKMQFNKASGRLDSVGLFLKHNSWEETYKKIFRPLYEKFQSRESIDSFFTLNKNNSLNMNNNFSKKLDSIKKSLINIPKKTKSVKADTEIKNPSKKEPQMLSFPSSLIFFFFVVILALVLVIFFLFWKKDLHTNKDKFFKKSKKKIQNRNKNSKVEDSEIKQKLTEVLNLKQEILNLKQEVSTLNKKLLELEDLIKNRMYMAPDYGGYLPKDKIDIKSEDKGVYNQKASPNDLKDATSDQYILYFTLPEDEGYFKLSSIKEEADEDTYFKVEISSNNSNVGRLHFIGDYDHRYYYIKPACYVVNEYERRHREFDKIKELEPGQVRREGDKWIVEKKVKVKLY